MTALDATSGTARSDVRHFGGGGDRPYEAALAAGAGRLRLARAGGPAGAGLPVPAGHTVLDVGRYAGPADAVDVEVLRRARGPVLDVGCGPGRMVSAALSEGMPALGLDVSAAAVAVARDRGLPVLHRSVFGHVPVARGWGTVLLLDGNVGIGGDPSGLLSRCAQLVAPWGAVVVETDRVATRDRVFEAVVTDEAGRRSLPFAWAEVGADALARHAAPAGLAPGERWVRGGRTFVRLVPAR
ncbi:methyltransferase domain-containing protein [Luteimicrobium sp. NPDC057192]|uniref:methyltransferase domain-containing protein n=1 Tax=Luteimicrobium sp. NPDC057192 TaxID=3346042 RepID=UPI00362FEE1B